MRTVKLSATVMKTVKLDIGGVVSKTRQHSRCGETKQSKLSVADYTTVAHNAMTIRYVLSRIASNLVVKGHNQDKNVALGSR